jgi:O-antigen/teichoic acid export membrane protein
MELGVGAVVQSALYGPLARNENKELSKIISSAGKFFRRLAMGMLIYLAVLLFIYPICINHNFNFFYTDTLILAMCISYIVQYFFGLKNQLLVIADQRGYVHYGLNTVALILNNTLGVILLLNGFSIQFVKLTSSLCLLMRPFILELYVRKNYKIDRKIQYEGEPIKQKWNGVAQHVASVVLNSTDTIVLTMFSTLSNVSIYNVYYLVVNGLRNLVISFSSGMQSLMGNLLANKETKKINEIFDVYESIFHIFVTFTYGCAAVLIVPFVRIYTSSVSDANYIVPIFGYLICFSNMAFCFRMPYNNMVLAAGHYKQTQNSAWIEMGLNIIISVITVVKYGLIGVAIGTLVAMLYRTCYMVRYLSKNIIYRKQTFFIKHFFTDCLCVVLIIVIGNIFKLKGNNYISWIFLALQKGAVNALICFVINIVVFRDSLTKTKELLHRKK